MPAIDSRKGIVCDFDFTSKKARLQMQTICNLVSYAEKRVQVIPVDSPGATLWLERKHVVLFVFVACELGWEQSSWEVTWKMLRKVPKSQLTALSPVTWKSFHNVLVLPSLDSGRKLLSAI